MIYFELDRFFFSSCISDYRNLGPGRIFTYFISVMLAMDNTSSNLVKLSVVPSEGYPTTIIRHRHILLQLNMTHSCILLYDDLTF